MPDAKKQLKNKQNKLHLKKHDSLKKAYALKNNGDYNPNKYHDISNIIESGDYGLDVLGNTIGDQVIPGKIINLGNQLYENNPSEYGRAINLGLELTKNITPFWGDAGINTIQKGVSYLSSENPKGIDRAYENYFNNEKGAKYSNGGYMKKLKYNKKGTYPTYEFPPMAFGGWLDQLPQQYGNGGNIDGVEPPPLVFDKNDPYGQMRAKAYTDSLNVYNGTKGDINKLKEAKSFDEWWNYSDNKRDAFNAGYRSYSNLAKLNKKVPQPVKELDRTFGNNGIGTAREYKKPTTPIQLIDERQPYSPIQTNQLNTVQLPISNIPLQQMPTIGIGEPNFEGNNAYWKKQDNQLIRQNNDYSNNMNLPISNKPGDRFHQEPSWMVGDDRYYERDGEAYLVPQPKGGWKNKQTLDASSGKWKSSIVKKANGGWLDEYSDGGSLTGPGKLLNRSRKEINKQRELEENLRKEGFNEDGVFTRVLPEYTVKSPEKKLYDEAYNKSIAQQQAFQNSWYPGSTDSDNLGYAPGVMDNIKQRATVKANDLVAKNLVNNNKIGDLKDYQKDYIATSNYSGKLRPNIGKQFTEGVQDLSRITQGKLPTSKSLGILSPLEYPVNLVRGTVKGEGVDALKGNISSPWLDANDVDPGAVNEVGVYNTMTDLALDPLNLSGTGALLGRTGVKYLNKALKTSKESGVLSNTYKLNPWAFKANPEAYYRGIGRTGLDDAMESGVLRSNRKGNFGDDLYLSSSFDEADYYANNRMPWTIDKEGRVVDDLIKGKGIDTKKYFAEIPKQNVNVTPYHINNTQFISKDVIPLDNVKLLKQDWLRGYKEVPKNKSNFKSEIDWSKWNKEIPDNPQLMKEYNAIEQTSKANGSWMKNPDGSEFRGTPEQFVQQNSSNFKKAYPDGFENVYRGVNFHNNEFPEKAIFTGNKNLAKKYTNTIGKENFLTSESHNLDAGVYNLAHKKSTNSIELNFNKDKWTDLPLKDKKTIINTKKKEFENYIKEVEETIKKTPSLNDVLTTNKLKNIKKYKEELKALKTLKENDPKVIKILQDRLGSKTSTDDLAKYAEQYNVDIIKLNNINDGGLGDVSIINNKKGNYLKSLIGNNGMFDMTNPNIYKALMPIGIGTGVGAGVLQQKKNGGWLDNL